MIGLDISVFGESSGAAAVPFNFDHVSSASIALWLDIGDVVIDGSSNVTAWPGHGGMPDVNAISSTPPVWGATSFGGVLPGVAMVKASSQWLAVDAAAAIVSGTDKEFAVCAMIQANLSGVNGDTYVAFGHSTAPTTSYHRITRPLGASWGHLIKDDASTLVESDVGTRDTNRHVLTWRVRNVSGAMKLSSWLEDTLIANEVAFDVGLISLDRFTIGAYRSATPSLPSDLILRGIVGYGGAPSDFEMAQIRAKARTIANA